MSVAVPPAVVPMTPEYWAEACAHLSRKDRVMKKLIPQFGDAILETRGDAFITLARSIVGQQISVKAAQTVWDRFSALTKRLNPAAVLKLRVDDMRAAGLSARKVEYLVDLAMHFSSGTVHVKAWQEMDDEAIITELVAIAAGADVGVSVAVQVIPPSTVPKLDSEALGADRSPIVKPVTASVKVKVTCVVSPIDSAVSVSAMLAVGRTVSTA